MVLDNSFQMTSNKFHTGIITYTGLGTDRSNIVPACSQAYKYVLSSNFIPLNKGNLRIKQIPFCVFFLQLGSFDLSCTRFYSAEVVSALEHLHGLGIIHRYHLLA